MIKVFEVIKECSISYTENGEDNGFCLYKGDFFFIEMYSCWVKKETRINHEPTYSKKSRLLKIFHNKLVWFGDNPDEKEYEWTWIDNINLVDPYINRNLKPEFFDKVNIYTGNPPCKDVTQQWEREDKLNKLLYE